MEQAKDERDRGERTLRWGMAGKGDISGGSVTAQEASKVGETKAGMGCKG